MPVQEKDIKENLDIEIRSSQKTIWIGRAKAVTSHNSQGEFDILPSHANFITIIQKRPILIHTSKKEVKKYNFESAIIYAHDNKVYIYTEV